MKFKNLASEMVKNGIETSDIANLLGKTQKSVSQKLNGKIDLYMDEIIKIRNFLNPELSIEYLFIN
ncbi:XRE family transcriptional regulator [bacterium]|nr:XRE family transcriptional regulator [bacterium]